MEIALARNLKSLQEYGFSEKQAEGILYATGIQEEKTEKKMVTKVYLDFQIEKMKNHLIIQAVAIVLASLGLLGWYINRVDNKTRHYIEAQFNAQDKRFDAQDKQFDAQDKRFDKIESDLKDIKNFIFSHSFSSSGIGEKHLPPISPPTKK